MSSKYNKEILEKVVIDKTSIAEVLKYFGLKLTGGNYSYLKMNLKKHEIDITHFLGQKHKKRSSKKITKEQFVEKYLKILPNDTFVKTQIIKERLIKFGFKESKCEICENILWNNLQIPLELHHINGNRWDNRINNLQIICPNCHSQTDNFCGRNINA